jgi:hypothetical protein
MRAAVVDCGVGFGEDVFGGFGLGEDEIGAGLQGLGGDGVDRVHGQEHDCRIGCQFAEVGSGVEAVEDGHGEIENDEVGGDFFGEVDGFASVAGFTGNGEAIGKVELGQLATDCGIVVDKEDGKAVFLRNSLNFLHLFATALASLRGQIPRKNVPRGDACRNRQCAVAVPRMVAVVSAVRREVE